MCKVGLHTDASKVIPGLITYRGIGRFNCVIRSASIHAYTVLIGMEFHGHFAVVGEYENMYYYSSCN